MPKPNFIELGDETRIPILYEDRSVLAVDKPPGWMLVPFSWENTTRNLQLAIASSISGGDFWARSRGLKFLKYVHRLDAETTGILLFAKSFGAVKTYGDLFESRVMQKRYLAVSAGTPQSKAWVSRLKIGPDGKNYGRMRIDPSAGKDAETEFKVLAENEGKVLVEAKPFTGRTHQIRLHLTAVGLPILGDALYGSKEDQSAKPRKPMALRAVELTYRDPFTKRPVRILAPTQDFLKGYGFDPALCSGS
jgi:23S rRNA pseudouridine1911/1915/1917 synthase